MATGKEPGRGTLVRGPEGALYYIPHSQLEGFRVPEDHVPAIQRAVDRGEHPTFSFPEPTLQAVVDVQPPAGVGLYAISQSR